MRLDKLIASQRTDLSRSMVKELGKKGLITVNGRVVKRVETHVDENNDEVCVNGENVSYKKFIYIMLNKPQDVVCSTRDGASQTVLEIIPPELCREGLFPAGRLDKDTEGFVLLTDDGVLAHTMLSPKSHVPKTYFVRLEKPWEESYADAFKGGMTIDGGEQCLPAEFFGGEAANECTVILHEGKFHQVKRMFAALGNEVVYLKRTHIGKMELDSKLALGECLEILHKDVDKLLAR